MNGCADAASKALALTTRGFGMPNTTLRHLLDAVASRRRIAASFDTSLLAMVRLCRALGVVRGGGSGGGRVGCGGAGNRHKECRVFCLSRALWRKSTDLSDICGWHPSFADLKVVPLGTQAGKTPEGGEYIVRLPGVLCSFSACACALMQGIVDAVFGAPFTPLRPGGLRFLEPILYSQGPVSISARHDTTQWHDMAQYVTLLWGGVSNMLGRAH